MVLGPGRTGTGKPAAAPSLLKRPVIVASFAIVVASAAGVGAWVSRSSEDAPEAQAVVAMVEKKYGWRASRYFDTPLVVDNETDRVLNVAVLEVSHSPDQEVVHGLVRLPYEISVSRAPDEAVGRSTS